MFSKTHPYHRMPQQPWWLRSLVHLPSLLISPCSLVGRLRLLDPKLSAAGFGEDILCFCRGVTAPPTRTAAQGVGQLSQTLNLAEHPADDFQTEVSNTALNYQEENSSVSFMEFCCRCGGYEFTPVAVSSASV